MNPARSNLISANRNACKSILLSLQLELPGLSPPAMSRASSLARRCSGIAWPLQQQLASSSFLYVEECVHVIFFTPEEAAAVASSSSSLISTIMRSRANIFPVPAPFARQSHVTILATTGELAAQKLRTATRSNGMRGSPIVIDLNHGLSGEINLPALAAIIHQGSNCLASSSSVLFVDIITQDNIFTELSLAVHHDMMNATHTAEWSHDGSLHLRFKSANRQHVQSSWFAGDMSCLTNVRLIASITTQAPALQFPNYCFLFLLQLSPLSILDPFILTSCPIYTPLSHLKPKPLHSVCCLYNTLGRFRLSQSMLVAQETPADSRQRHAQEMSRCPGCGCVRSSSSSSSGPCRYSAPAGRGRLLPAFLSHFIR